MSTFTEADANSLAEKLENLELSSGEAGALGALIANACEDDVAGFGWDEGVAAFSGKQSLKISAELGAGVLAEPLRRGLFPSRS